MTGYAQILAKMREAALAGRVFLTFHANKELKNDKLSYDDVINCILTGEIIEQQFDAERGEDKYLIFGDSLMADEMAVVARLGYNDDTVIITAYRLRITDYE